MHFLSDSKDCFLKCSQEVALQALLKVSTIMGGGGGGSPNTSPIEICLTGVQYILKVCKVTEQLEEEKGSSE